MEGFLASGKKSLDTACHIDSIMHDLSLQYVLQGSAVVKIGCHTRVIKGKKKSFSDRRIKF